MPYVCQVQLQCMSMTLQAPHHSSTPNYLPATGQALMHAVSQLLARCCSLGWYTKCLLLHTLHPTQHDRALASLLKALISRKSFPDMWELHKLTTSHTHRTSNVKALQQQRSPQKGESPQEQQLFNPAQVPLAQVSRCHIVEMSNDVFRSTLLIMHLQISGIKYPHIDCIMCADCHEQRDVSMQQQQLCNRREDKGCSQLRFTKPRKAQRGAQC